MENRGQSTIYNHHNKTRYRDVMMMTLPADKKEKLQFPMEVHNIAPGSLILVKDLLKRREAIFDYWFFFLVTRRNNKSRVVRYVRPIFKCIKNWCYSIQTYPKSVECKGWWIHNGAEVDEQIQVYHHKELLVTNSGINFHYLSVHCTGWFRN